MHLGRISHLTWMGHRMGVVNPRPAGGGLTKVVHVPARRACEGNSLNFSLDIELVH